MRQRKGSTETNQPEVDLSESTGFSPITDVGQTIGYGTWNTFGSPSRRPEAVLVWTIGGMGDGSIRLSIESPTDAGIDRLATLAERFAELAL